MPQTWEWAVEMYSGTSMKAVDIARALGISRPLLSYRMNRAGVPKYGRQRNTRARMFRCGVCRGISEGPVCDSCGAIINPFLVAS